MSAWDDYLERQWQRTKAHIEAFGKTVKAIRDRNARELAEYREAKRQKAQAVQDA